MEYVFLMLGNFANGAIFSVHDYEPKINSIPDPEGGDDKRTFLTELLYHKELIISLLSWVLGF